MDVSIVGIVAIFIYELAYNGYLNQMIMLIEQGVMYAKNNRSSED